MAQSSTGPGLQSKAVRFAPARSYLTAAAVAFGLAAFSGWIALRWLPAAVPAILLLMSAAAVLWLALRPAIYVSDAGLSVESASIRWSEVRRVDQTGWVSPLVVYLTLCGGSRLRLVYPGETEESNRLLRMIQQRSTSALINGVPYRQIFGDPKPAQPAAQPAPKFRLLTEDDEVEVERLYQKLRTAGRIDPEK
ncbi:MAG: hypothetical protein HY821_01985 [Acidobacteria bacterium]|nr:hypothetical protein [Acidobacteriota bacterium]